MTRRPEEVEHFRLGFYTGRPAILSSGLGRADTSAEGRSGLPFFLVSPPDLHPGGLATPPPGAPHETTQGPVSLPEHDIVSAHQRAEQRAAERLSGTSGG